MRTLRAVALATVLLAAPSTAFAVQDVERVLRVYGCEFIFTARPDFPGPDLTRFFPDEGFDEMDADEDAFLPALEPEILIEMIRRNVRPDSWLHEKNRIGIARGKLTVVQTPDVHAEIDRFLAVLRAAQMRMIGLHCTALSVDADHFRASSARESGLLAPADFEHFFGPDVTPDRVRRVSTVSLLAYSGQLVHAGPVDRTRFVRDLAVEVAEESTGQAPQVDDLLTGTVFSLRPSIVGPGTVLLDVDAAHAERVGEITQVETGIGQIDIPVRSLQSVRTTVLLARGHGALFAASAAEGRVLVFVVRPRILTLSAGETAREARPEGARRLRVYNTRLLTAEIEDKPCPIHRRLEIGQVAEESAFGGASEGVNVAPDTLVAMIKEGIAEDTWSNTRNSIRTAGDLLVVVQRPEVHEKIRRFLDGLGAKRGVLVATRIRVLSVDPAWLRASLPAEARIGGALVPEAVSALEQAIRDGGSVRQLHAASVTSFNRQRAHAQTVTERSVIRTAVVEIASKSVIYDPVVGALRRGLFLDVRPSLVGDGKHLALDLFGCLSTHTTPRLEPRSEELYFVHKFDRRTVDLQTSVLLPDGGTVALSRGPVPGESGRRLLVVVSARSVRVTGS